MSNEQIDNEMKYQIVVTSYGTNKRTYRIEKIDFLQSPSSSFQKSKDD